MEVLRRARISGMKEVRIYGSDKRPQVLVSPSQRSLYGTQIDGVTPESVSMHESGANSLRQACGCNCGCTLLNMANVQAFGSGSLCAQDSCKSLVYCELLKLRSQSVI